MALEMPLDADSFCAYLGVEGHHKSSELSTEDIIDAGMSGKKLYM